MRALAAIAFVAACSGKAASHEPQTFQVEIRGMQFVPATLHVHQGDLVVWTNHDFVPHTVTSPGWFDSGPVAPGQQWSHAVTERLDFSYVCTMHPTMHGQLLAQ